MSTIDDLLESMPGLAGVVARDIADTAWIRQPMLAIQSSLCLMSCLKGQNVQYESGMSTNIFWYKFDVFGSSTTHIFQK